MHFEMKWDNWTNSYFRKFNAKLVPSYWLISNLIKKDKFMHNNGGVNTISSHRLYVSNSLNLFFKMNSLFEGW